MANKLTALLFLGGVMAIGTGAYDAFIEAEASANPTKISIAGLDQSVPSNRNLVVTGARAMMNEAVVYYNTRSYAKVPGSEIYFIPLQDAALASYSTLTPSILLRMTENQMQEIRSEKHFDASSVPGMRMTRFELENKAKEALAQKFGESAVKKMLILDYKRKPVGIRDGLGKIVGGLAALVLGLVWSTDWLNRLIEEKRALPTEVPPIIRT